MGDIKTAPYGRGAPIDSGAVECLEPDAAARSDSMLAPAKSPVPAEGIVGWSDAAMWRGPRDSRVSGARISRFPLATTQEASRAVGEDLEPATPGPATLMYLQL